MMLLSTDVELPSGLGWVPLDVNVFLVSFRWVGAVAAKMTLMDNDLHKRFVWHSLLTPFERSISLGNTQASDDGNGLGCAETGLNLVSFHGRLGTKVGAW